MQVKLCVKNILYIGRSYDSCLELLTHLSSNGIFMPEHDLKYSKNVLYEWWHVVRDPIFKTPTIKALNNI